MNSREKAKLEKEIETKYLKSKRELEMQLKNQIKKLSEEKKQKKQKIRKEYREFQKRKLKAKSKLENKILLQLKQNYIQNDIAEENNICRATIHFIKKRNEKKEVKSINANKIREI